ncbi:hypothetical protein ZIOFF_051144 [Zingiber officinale]|uniref:Uncharacterized protein n=1 Tax=Zingiber officinale TaxID=94328 RepID=A0A8J5FM77_ZINOF|nr:hypothetical protein ZIOFF_051144 [Zingiber officinale]
MPPVPASWRGGCVRGESFDPKKACNRKLVGAKYYVAGFEREYGALNTTGEAEYRSPRDRIGHGSHTASTAAGSAAAGASYFGFGSGAARGGAPRARVAAYKVCWFREMDGACSEADVLAAFDEALRDGVGVISVSLGSPPPLIELFRTSTDIGAFHAAQLGTPVVFSAGNNDDRLPSLVQNVSPWSICVAAATIDRTFPTQIVLGNNLSFTGEGFIRKEMKAKLVESIQLFTDGSCNIERWNRTRRAPGAIILCFAAIGDTSSAFAALNPTARIMPSRTAIGSSPAPSVAYFSSRGPSSVSPDILKIKSMLLPSPSVDVSCAAGGKHSDLELNYPAIVVSELRATVTVKRTLRNVGQNRHAVYFAAVVSPHGVSTVVWPPLLVFSGQEEASYYVTMSPAKRSQGRYDFGEIVWSDGYHRVRTPLAVQVTNIKDGGPHSM